MWPACSFFNQNAFELHIRFLWQYLDSTDVPPTASAILVQGFELRFDGVSVLEMRRQGQVGANLIPVNQVKVRCLNYNISLLSDASLPDRF
jgi:hypothetical protein